MSTTDWRSNQPSEGEASALAPATGTSRMNVGDSERIISAVGGAALAIAGLRDVRSAGGIGMLLAGGALLFRGLGGYCPVNQAVGRNTARKPGAPVEVRTRVSLNKQPEAVYAFWRRLENLPRIMSHLEKVEQLDDTRSRWTAKGLGGVGSVSWEAEIVEDHQNEYIAWRSLPGSSVDNAGEVRFLPTPGGTDIRVQMSYRLPAGAVGTVAAKAISPITEKMIRHDIRELRSVLESEGIGAPGTPRTF